MLSDEKLSDKVRVQDVPLDEITVDVEKFQNRSSDFSQETVDSIIKDAKAGKFNWENLILLRYG